MPADIWLYVSGGGFALSALLWPYLFRRYRRASSSVSQATPTSVMAEPLKPLTLPAQAPAQSPAVTSRATAQSCVASGSVPGSAVSTQESQPVALKPKATTGTVKLAPVQTSAPPQAAQTAGTQSAQPLLSPARGGAAVVAAAMNPQTTAAQGAPKQTSAQTVSAPQGSKTLAELKTGQTVPGGLSPAVMYLQGVKTQLDRLDKELKAVKEQISGMAQRQESQFQALLKELQAIELRAWLGRAGPALSEERSASLPSSNVAAVKKNPSTAETASPQTKPASGPGAAPGPAGSIVMPAPEPNLVSIPPPSVPGAELKLNPASSPASPPERGPVPSTGSAPQASATGSINQPPNQSLGRKGPVWPV